MDRVLSTSEKAWYLAKRPLWFVGVLGAVLSGAGYFLASADNTPSVPRERLTLASVGMRTLASSTSVRGTAAAKDTTLVSASVTGRIDAVHAQAGDTVAEGAPIASIANIESKLAINSEISRIEAALNGLRSQTIEVTRSRFADKRAVLDTDFTVNKLTSEISRKEELVKRGVFPAAEAELLRGELTFQQAILAEYKSVFEENEVLRRQQEASIASQRTRLEDNLNLARQRLSDFAVKARKGGQIVSLSVEEGETVTAGQAIAQIDQQTGFVVESFLDEYYLGKVQVGDVATFRVAGREIAATINRVDPEVKDGVFRVEFALPEGISDLRTGQALQGVLTLSEAQPALAVANGAFMATSNGRWAYVLSPDGTQAIRRAVSLRPTSPAYLTVESGLAAGDVIIVSEYESLDGAPTIRLE